VNKRKVIENNSQIRPYIYAKLNTQNCRTVLVYSLIHSFIHSFKEDNNMPGGMFVFLSKARENCLQSFVALDIKILNPSDQGLWRVNITIISEAVSSFFHRNRTSTGPTRPPPIQTRGRNSRHTFGEIENQIFDWTENQKRLNFPNLITLNLIFLI